MHRDFSPLSATADDDGNLRQQPRAREQTKPAAYRHRIRATPEEDGPLSRAAVGKRAWLTLPLPKVMCSSACSSADPRCPPPPETQPRAAPELRAPRPRAPQGEASSASFSLLANVCAETQSAQKS